MIGVGCSSGSSVAPTSSSVDVSSTDAAPTSSVAPATSAAPTTAAPAAVTIHPDGFGDAMLNDDPESVIAYFTELFGPALTDSGWTTGASIALCDTDAFRAVNWPNMYAVFAERDALGGGRRDTQHFVFFSYGMKDGVLPVDPIPTDEGLVPGDPVERLLELYPGVVVYDGSLGGRFYRSSEDRNLGPNGIVVGAPEIVASIEAGDWPCQDTD